MNITSTQNPLIQDILSLRESKARKTTGRVLIDGPREIERAIACGITVEMILFCRKFLSQTIDLPKIAGKKVPLIEVGDKVFEKIAYGDRYEGIIAVVKGPHLSLSDLRLPSHPLVVVIESVEKPGNLGAILRTCDGAGVDAVLICDAKTDLYNPNAIRSSVATVFKVPSVVVTKEDALAFLNKKNIKLLGMFPEAKDIYSKVNLKGSIAIVLGAEDKGLSLFWENACAMKIRIPMQGLADSLNVSVSTAVVLYEALRQRS